MYQRDQHRRTGKKKHCGAKDCAPDGGFSGFQQMKGTAENANRSQYVVSRIENCFYCNLKRLAFISGCRSSRFVWNSRLRCREKRLSASGSRRRKIRYCDCNREERRTDPTDLYKHAEAFI